MRVEEIFKSATRSAGDFSGVFEFDGDTSYFYLYRLHAERRIVDAIHVCSGAPDFEESEIEIR